MSQAKAEPEDAEDLTLNIHDALERYSRDSRIDAALKLAIEGKLDVSATDGATDSFQEFLEELDAELRESECDNVGDYVASCEDLLLLHQELSNADAILCSMEEMLSSFHTGLADMSSGIRTLQQQSSQMNLKLGNRKVADDLLSTFVSQILITPELVNSICTDPIDDEYVNKLAGLSKKLEHASQPGIREKPACSASVPQLSQLRLKAVTRIRSFLASKISDLKRPKTNIQILQRNILIPQKTLYHFLSDFHPQSAFEVRTLYVQVVSHVYYSQFKVYIQSLQSLEYERAMSRKVVVGMSDSTVVPPVASNLSLTTSAKAIVGNLFGLNTAASGGVLPPGGIASGGTAHATDQYMPVGNINVFSLGNRDEVLNQLDAPPLIRHLAASKHYHYEHIFRSEQLLLLDTASSEFCFLSDFFSNPTSSISASKDGDSFNRSVHAPLGCAPGEALFTDVFQRTLHLVAESVEAVVSTSYDTIGLTLLAVINEHNGATMKRRRLCCLDAFLDRIQVMIHARLTEALRENVASLRDASASRVFSNALATQPHYTMRRYAELASALQVLLPYLGPYIADNMKTSLAQLQLAAESLLDRMSSAMPFKRESETVTFRINNLDMILSIFNERNVTHCDAVNKFTNLLRDSTGIYVESQLQSYFGDFIDFVREAEIALSSSSGATADSEALQNRVDVLKMQKLVKKFSAKWRPTVAAMRSTALTSFTNFSKGLAVLKQILTQLLLYHARFQKIVFRVYPSDDATQPSWTAELVPTSVILAELRRLSQNLK